MAFRCHCYYFLHLPVGTGHHSAAVTGLPRVRSPNGAHRGWVAVFSPWTPTMQMADGRVKKRGNVTPKYSPSLPLLPPQSLKASLRNSPGEAVQVGKPLRQAGKEATNVLIARPSLDPRTSCRLPSQGAAGPLIRRRARRGSGQNSQPRHRTPKEDDPAASVRLLAPPCGKGASLSITLQEFSCLYPRLKSQGKNRLQYLLIMFFRKGQEFKAFSLRSVYLNSEAEGLKQNNF